MERRRRPWHLSPYWLHGGIGLGLTVVGTVALWASLSGHWSWAPWVLAWLGAVNVIALVYYGYDKTCARHGWRRVPEVVLHLLALAGGSLGAFAGMRLFRHKTLKGSFQALFWFTVAWQVALLAFAGYQVWFHPG